MILRRWVTEKSSLSLPATLDQLPPNCSPTTRASVRRTTASFKSASGKSAPDNRWDSSRAAGNTPAKRPGNRYLGRARRARPAPCPAICGIEDGFWVDGAPPSHHDLRHIAEQLERSGAT